LPEFRAEAVKLSGKDWIIYWSGSEAGGW